MFCSHLAIIAMLSILSASTFALDPKLAPDKQTKVEAAIARFMAANQIPGVSVAIVENNAFEWAAGFGMADLENYVPATLPDSLSPRIHFKTDHSHRHHAAVATA
jgi:CubicO group peptidase (beta-lactamase class C family)